MKALGTGWRGISFREIAMLRSASGKPCSSLRTGRERAQRRGVREMEVSITHTAGMAAAVVASMTDDAPRFWPSPVSRLT